VENCWFEYGPVQDVVFACEYGQSLMTLFPGAKIMFIEYCRSIPEDVPIEHLKEVFTKEDFLKWVRQHPEVRARFSKKQKKLALNP
jgi:hypothetical protein